MLNMRKDLDERYKLGSPLSIGLIGTGKMGAGLLAQLYNLPGIRPSFVVNRNIEKAKRALISAGFSEEDFYFGENGAKRDLAFKKGKIIVSEDYNDIYDYPIEAVVDATGNPSLGAEIAFKTIDAEMDIIALNVEMDAVVGPLLLEKARKAGVIYTGSAGDEPAAIVDLASFVMGNGFELLAVGKGKNNPLNLYTTAAEQEKVAEKANLNKEMLVGFVDGTNTMLEMSQVGNALGFLPDVIGGHGAKLNKKELAKFYSLKEEGGNLNQYGIVDFSFGTAPGVYAIATTKSDEVRNLLAYSSMGEGPNYAFIRPFHLTCLETPTSIYRALVKNEITIAPEAGLVVDTVARAKRDIKKGEYIKGIGSDDFYGLMMAHSLQKKENYVPIGLITEGTRAFRDIKKDEYIRSNDIIHEKDELIHKLRRELEGKEGI